MALTINENAGLPVLKSNLESLLTMNAVDLVLSETDFKMFELQLLMYINEECSPYVEKMPDYKVILAKESNMWRVSSALGKCIRRGWSEYAVKYAQCLMNSSKGSYFWKRLAVIVMEDIGIADPLLCAMVLCMCGPNDMSKKNRMSHEKLIGSYLVDRMAKADKSRALCDLCFSSELNEVNKKSDLLAHTLKWAIANTHETFWGPKYYTDPKKLFEMNQYQYMAVSHLMGNREYEKEENVDNVYSVPVGVNALLQSIAETEDILSTYIMKASTKVDTQGMAQAWPVVMANMKGDVGLSELINNPTTHPHLLHGIPDVAFDMHTSEGKRAIAYYSKAFKPVAEFFAAQGIDPELRQGILHAGIFIMESGLLDRQVNTQYLRVLNTLFNQLWLEKRGLEFAGARVDLLKLLVTTESRSSLLQARTKILSSEY
jgi:hypothetical protein